MPKLGYVDLPFGQPPEPDPGITRLGVDNAGNLIASIGGAAFSPVGGGGSGFGTPFEIDQPNSVNAQFPTWVFANTFTNNTSGSETANLRQSVPVAGVQTFFDPSAVNSNGKSAPAATSGSTPSVAMPLRADLLVVTLRADVTSLTIAGLDLDTDFEYEISGSPLIGGGAQVNCDLNGTTSGYVGLLVFAHSSFGAPSSLTRFALIDAIDASATGMFVARLRGATGNGKVFSNIMQSVGGGQVYWENATGTSTITANVTSLVLNGAMKAGTVITIKRCRTSAKDRKSTRLNS